jgi:hypothetical protein
MSKPKVHFRIPKQVTERFYGPGMKALCGNKKSKRFDVSAKNDAANCLRCIALYTQSQAEFVIATMDSGHKW